MKNILKRGTSLLLVVAMLLSFAVVVGAEPATTESGTGNKLVTLWADTVPLQAGGENYAFVPIYAKVDKQNGLGMLQFDVYCDPGLTIVNVTNANGTTLPGSFAANDYGSEGKWRVIWSGDVPLGWTAPIKKGNPPTPPTTEDVLVCWAVVEATGNSIGGHQIHFGALDGNEANKPYRFIYMNGEDISQHPEDHPFEDVTLEDGAAIVYNTLPMVALTKTTFDVPTMADWRAGTDGSHDLPKYLKIVYKDGAGNVQMDDVSSATMDKKTEGKWPAKNVSFDKYRDNRLTVNPAANDGDEGELTVTAATAKTSNVTYQVNSDVTFKVRKATSVLTSLAFTNNRIEDNANISAPKQSATQDETILGLGLEGKDQFDGDMTLTSSDVAVAFYSDAKCEESSKLDATPVGITVSNEIRIKNTLENDVWCKLTATGTAGEKQLTKTVTFKIESTKPHAKSAEIVLKDVKGNQYTDSQGKPLYIFTIPAPGQNPVQIKIDATVYDQKNGVMDGVTYTVKAYWGTKDTPGTDIPETGVEASATLSDANVLEITSKALENLGSATEVKLTVEITVNGISDKITQEIKLVKAQPVATYLAAGADGTASNLVRGNIFLNHNVVYLPGINETKESLSAAYPVYVMDQYDQPIQNDGKNATVPAANFKLYPATSATESEADSVKFVGDNEFYKKNGNEIDGKYAKFEDNSGGGVKLTITNGWDKDNKRLAVPDGHYIIEATYPNPNNGNQQLVARCVIKLTKAPVPTTVTVEAARDITVPEKGASEESVNLTATVKDQYGDDVSGVKLSTDGKINAVYKPNGSAIVAFENDQAAGVTTGAFDNVLVLKVSNQLAWYMVEKDMPGNVTSVVTEGELRLPVKVTVGEGENAKTFNTTAKVNVSREASALKKATVVMKQGETEVASEALTAAEYQKDVNLISPKTKTEYTFTVTGEDQYGDDMSVTYYLDGTTPGKFESSAATGGYKLTVYPDVEGEPVLRFTAGGLTWQWKMKFAKMQFVKGETGSEQITAKDMLDDSNIPGTYDGSTWNLILTAAKKNQDVYIKNEVEGGTNEKVATDSISYKVVSVDADGHETEIPDTAKANAGSYKIKVIYTKDGQTYDVCEKTFKIEPKEVRIVLDTGAKIEKEYDGTKNLPDVTLAVTAYETLNVDKSVLKFAQENVGTDINVELTSADANCLKTASGEPATNYTADLSELKGTITARQLTVTPKAKTFEYGENDKITTALTTEFDYAGKNGDLPSGLTPTIEGSMALTKGAAEASAPYDAGEYTVALGNLSLTGTSAGNYQLELATTPITWTINQQAVTLVSTSKKSYVFGETSVSEIKTALENAPVTIGGTTVQLKNLGTVTFEPAGSLENKHDILGAGEKEKYPIPGTYTATVTTASKTNIGKNYYVDENTQYSVQVEITKSSKPMSVTLVRSSDPYAIYETPFTYNGSEQGSATVAVSFKPKDGVLLYLPSEKRTEEGTLKATDAGTYTYRVSAPDFCEPGEATWKINQKNIADSSITINQTTNVVYDGMKKTLNGSLLTVTDTAIGQNGGTKLWMGERNDYTVNLIEGTDANEDAAHAADYQLTVTGQGNYTGTKTFNATIKKFVGTVEKPLFSKSISSKQVTRGKTTTLYIDTNVVLKSNELEGLSGEETSSKTGVLQWQPKNVPEGITVNVETTGDFKLKVTVTVPNDIKMTDPAPQFTLELSAKFPASANHQNIVSTEYTNYEISVTDKEQQENFKIDQGESGTYSYSQGGVQLTTSGNEGDVTWSSNNTSVATVDGNGKVTFVKPGNVTITATASETDDYAATSDTYTLTITKGQVMITASSATMTANDPLPGFSATASGLNPNDSVSEVFQTLTATVSTDGKTAGTFRVTPNAVFKTGVKDWNEYYELSFVQGTLTVNPAVSVIDTVLPTIIAGNGCANGYANCACESFYDLDASRWYHEAIDWAYNLGLMNGTTKSTFGPNAAATRAQTWTMLARIAGQDTRRSSTWYEVGQKWAMDLGITDGTNPMGSLTREQLAAMLYRYVGSPAVNGTLTFTDSANVSAWARNAMIWAVQNGILDGVGGNRLNPKGTTTRAQAAAIFMRFSKLINK